MNTNGLSASQREAKDVGLLAIWTLAWLATLAVAQFGPELWWDDQPILSWVAITANVLVGVGWIVAHSRFLRGVDDLQRKIMLDAIAVALGVGLVIGFAYTAAKSAGLIAFASDIAFLSVLMAIVYLGGIAVGKLRYR
jgi:hypothetical protein